MSDGARHMARRRYLASMFAAVALPSALSSWGSGAAASESAPPPEPAPDAWNLASMWVATVGRMTTWALSASLPPGVPLGGRFEVSTSGAALPAGVTLSIDGVLTVSPDSPIGQTSGIVLSYTTP